MIFVTVGTQLPFPRLIAEMVNWAGAHNERVVLQTGDTSVCGTCEAHRSLPSDRFLALMEEARIIVSHAGIGSIIAAKTTGRPIILVPRRADLGEHRNDHQMATATAFEGKLGLRVAWKMDDLSTLLDQPIEAPVAECNPRYDRLVERIRSFVAA